MFERCALPLFVLLSGAAVASGQAAEAPPVVVSGPPALTASLRATEEAFASAFAERDEERFFGYLSEEATFMGGARPLRGRAAVEEAWRGYFANDEAPFSWRPTQVAVDDRGELGVTSGPVLDREGNPVGAFVSVWRRQEDGSWRILFDTGPPCPRCR